MTIGLAFRSLESWPYPATAKRKPPTFRVTWSATRALLLDEAERLGAKLVVVEFDVAPGAIRRDGELRADARAGDFPGVRVSFGSRHGPLTYATDRYAWQWAGAPMKDWQANCRAIALSLEALRAVDRHGVTRRGEQYTGWRALPAGAGQAVAGPNGSVEVAAAAPLTRERAARILADLAGSTDPAGLARELLGDRDAVRYVWKSIVRRMHPDRAGTPELFAQASAAHDILERTV